jgi:hypothetical protein
MGRRPTQTNRGADDHGCQVTARPGKGSGLTRTPVRGGIIVPMTLPPPYRVLRDRIADVLADQGGPMTAAQLAALLLPPDLDSARRQTQRALAQLETAGHAVRQHGQWTSR